MPQKSYLFVSENALCKRMHRHKIMYKYVCKFVHFNTNFILLLKFTFFGYGLTLNYDAAGSNKYPGQQMVVKEVVLFHLHVTAELVISVNGDNFVAFT